MAADLLHGGSVVASDPRDLDATAHPRADSSRESLAHLCAGVRVLLVEDDRDSRELMQFMLERRGAEVTAVGSVREALEVLDRAPPAVVVSDIAMPGEDGYALIRKIRALGLRIPAVAVTAFSRAHDRERALAAGFQAHLTKPVEIDIFCGAIARLAAGS
jgi:CheY-like chemotaxis protein